MASNVLVKSKAGYSLTFAENIRIDKWLHSRNFKYYLIQTDGGSKSSFYLDSWKSTSSGFDNIEKTSFTPVNFTLCHSGIQGPDRTMDRMVRSGIDVVFLLRD